MSSNGLDAFLANPMIEDDRVREYCVPLGELQQLPALTTLAQVDGQGNANQENAESSTDENRYLRVLFRTTTSGRFGDRSPSWQRFSCFFQELVCDRCCAN